MFELPGRPLHGVLRSELVHGLLRSWTLRRLEHEVLVVLLLRSVLCGILLQSWLDVSHTIRLWIRGCVLPRRLRRTSCSLTRLLRDRGKLDDAHFASEVPLWAGKVLLRGGNPHLPSRTLRDVGRTAVFVVRWCLCARLLLPRRIDLQVSEQMRQRCRLLPDWNRNAIERAQGPLLWPADSARGRAVRGVAMPDWQVVRVRPNHRPPQFLHL